MFGMKIMDEAHIERIQKVVLATVAATGEARSNGEVVAPAAEWWLTLGAQ